jgi:ComF family protein
MATRGQVYNWLHNIQSTLFPASCLLCGDAVHGALELCAPCHKELPFNRPACPRCGRPFPGGADLCGACLRRPPPYAALTAALRYEPPVDRLVQGLKFNHRLENARLLGRLLADTVAAILDEPPELILPVPLHPARLRQRGFNQALELARPLASRLGIPIGRDYCRRLRATEEQSHLPAKGRRANVRGAFKVVRPVRARHVAVVDDVVTTGSTVGELSRALRRSGVEHVEVWACTRAARPA